jgi:hypothetical protein
VQSACSPAAVLTEAKPAYSQRGTNALQLIFRQRFSAFAELYQDRYAKQFGLFRLPRITHVAEKFIRCGDYSQGVARIQCSNPDCRFELFRPFSCKGFYLCPCCSQKRALLFAEYLDNELLLALPHRQFVFSIPKALRVFFHHDQRLFSAVSSLIFSLISEFYSTAARTQIRSAAVVAFQPFGDLLRANSHWHALILEGGFGPAGQFVFIPIHDTQKLTECFRRRVIGMFLAKGLIANSFAEMLLSWKHSGFSVNNSVRIAADDHKARVSLAQYIARAPLSLEKLHYDPEGGKALYHSTYNPYLGENLKVWDINDFLALATSFIPPQGVRLIRYRGLYSSRSRWKWPRWEHVAAHAPRGWKQSHGSGSAEPQAQAPTRTLPEASYRSAWARLIAQVYEVDPLLCPKCSHEMRVLAVITDPAEVKKILRHLVNIGRSPPGLDPSVLN